MVNRAASTRKKIRSKAQKLRLLAEPTSLKHLVLVGAIFSQKSKLNDAGRLFYRAHLLDNFKTELITHNLIKLYLITGQNAKAVHISKKALCFNPFSEKTAEILENAESHIEQELKSDVKTKLNFENLVKIYKSTYSRRLKNRNDGLSTKKIQKHLTILINPKKSETQGLNGRIPDKNIRAFFYSYVVQSKNHSTIKNIFYAEKLKNINDHKNVQRLLSVLGKTEKKNPIYLPILIWINARNKNYGVIGELVKNFITKQSKNVHIWNSIGLEIEALKHKRETRKFYELAAQKFPDQCDILHNYAQSEFDLENIAVAKAVCLKIIMLKPQQIKSINLIGIIWGIENKEEQALIFLKRCLLIRENWPPALLNIGMQHSNLGNFRSALSYKIKALRHEKTNKAKPAYNLALELIGRGKLKLGYELYRMRWAAEGFYAEKRAFPQPYLNLKDRKKVKRLALFTEQGLGDEFMYSWYLRFIEKEYPSTVVEIDHRLIRTFQKSFVELNFVSRENPINNIITSNKISHQAPLVDMARFYTSEVTKEIKKIRCGYLKKYEKNPGWIKVDSLKTNTWGQFLSQNYGDVKKIGVFWRSQITSVKRAKHYLTPALLSLGLPDNVLLVNLQYSYEQSEILGFQKRIQKNGSKFFNPEAIDLKNDIDELLALLKNLDLVVGPLISTAWMAAAIGVPSVILRSERKGYIWQQFGENFVPWAPSMRLLFRDPNTDWVDTMSKLKYILEH